MNKYSMFMLSLVITALSSCAKVDSTQVKSGGIFATFHVTGDSSAGAVCEAVFQVGDVTGTFMSLAGGDQVTCDGKPMTRTEFLGTVTYSVSVDYDLAKTYTLLFQRPNEPDYKADMTLPDPVSITWPRPADRVSGGSGVELKWALGATTTYDLSVAVSGANETTVFSPETPDIGSKLLPAESLKLPDGSTAENFTATVTRSRAGSFPVGLAGGRSAGRQQANVTFTVTK